MRLTKRTNISMRVLMYCAINTDRLVTKGEIADVCNISENHLAQVINRLGQLGFLETHRGRNGGMVLGRRPEDITVGEVFRRVEGPVPIVECLADGANTCPMVHGCRMREAIQEATEAFYRKLDKVRLDELLCGQGEYANLLTPIACTG